MVSSIFVSAVICSKSRTGLSMTIARLLPCLMSLIESRCFGFSHTSVWHRFRPVKVVRPGSNSLVLHRSGTCLHEPESLEHSQEYRTNAGCRYRGEDCSVQHSHLERPYSHRIRTFFAIVNSERCSKPRAGFQIKGTRPRLCSADEQWKLQHHSAICPGRVFQCQTKSDKARGL